MTEPIAPGDKLSMEKLAAAFKKTEATKRRLILRRSVLVERELPETSFEAVRLLGWIHGNGR